ncbi:STAS domain-containing protein [Noviherbaspirillum sp. 17J57-3]|uniref:Anti-sigma factor antagonist n=2 Tax=Noviherbaspirillum galbum TaxID=2709383 RepID=A0A6B3STZ0_9BURK|nr:STAS domain-containing protein [Noviherbaspirillum galbum]
MAAEQELIDISKNNEVTIIRPRIKRLDATVALAFKEAVLKVIATGEQVLVLNLDAVQFMDSSGLGAVVSVLKALGSRGKLAVCNANGALLSLFKLTRMDKVFTISGSMEEAMQQLGT